MRNRLIGYFIDESYYLPLDGQSWRTYPKKKFPEDPDAFLLFQDASESIPYIEGYGSEAASMRHYRGGWIK